LKNSSIALQAEKEHFHKVSSSPLGLFLASIAYTSALIYCLAEYAAVVWSEYGFSFGEISVMDACVLCVTLMVWAIVLPKKIYRPSSLFLIVIYLFVCIPAAVAMVGLEVSSNSVYYPLLVSLGCGFTATCVVVSKFPWQGVLRKEVAPLLPILVFAWAVCLVILLVSFGPVMSFSGLDDIYVQRDKGKAENLFEGYLQTYFGYVFSPALLAFGLLRKNVFLITAGVTGSVILYMITAEKAVFMYPLFTIFVSLALRLNASILLIPSFIALVFSALLFFATLFHNESAIASFVAWYLGIRSLLVPGTFTVHYNNFFIEVGHTYGTHITGFGLFIDTPGSFLAHPRWPSIGHLVGEDFLGIPTLNANANFIAWDGLAAFGLTGIFFSLFLFTAVLVALDRCSRGVDPNLLLLLLIPLALTLTNGSLFTGLTSFGGLFWIICFVFLFRRQAAVGIHTERHF
jgi:hypothetical protein